MTKEIGLGIVYFIDYKKMNEYRKNGGDKYGRK
jgi:hypothetical protein